MALTGFEPWMTLATALPPRPWPQPYPPRPWPRPCPPALASALPPCPGPSSAPSLRTDLQQPVGHAVGGSAAASVERVGGEVERAGAAGQHVVPRVQDPARQAPARRETANGTKVIT